MRRVLLAPFLMVIVMVVAGVAVAVAQEPSPVPSPLSAAPVVCDEASEWTTEDANGSPIPVVPVLTCETAVAAAMSVVDETRVASIEFGFGIWCPPGAFCALTSPSHGHVLFHFQDRDDLVVVEVFADEAGRVTVVGQQALPSVAPSDAASPAAALSPDPSPAVSPGPAAPVGQAWVPMIESLPRHSGFTEATAWAGGFAMVRLTGERAAPEVWRSADGRDWQHVRGPKPDGRLTSIDLWASGSGLVLAQTTGSGLTSATLTFSRSADGVTWDRAGSLSLEVPARLRGCMLDVEGIGETAAGFVVIADICRTECCGSISPGVAALAQALPAVADKGGVWTWTSPTGRSWTRTRTAGVGDGTLSTVTQDGAELLAILDGDGPATLVRSADGVTWDVVATLPPELDTQNLPHLQPTGEGVLLIGDVPLPEGVTNGNASRGWLLVEALGWRQVLDLPGTFVFATTGDAAALLVTGVDQGYLDAPDHAWTRRSLDGGLTWELSAGWPGMTGICFGSVAVSGATAIAATGCTGRGGDDPAAWISTDPAAVAP